MSRIWVRTGSGGADPDFLIRDLGYIVIPGSSWTLLSAGSNSDPQLPSGGPFTSIELKNSDSLHTALLSGDLEYSTNGTSQDLRAYVADLPLLNDFEDDHFNLVTGRLTLPNRGLAYTDPILGDIYLDTSDGYLYYYDGYAYKVVGVGSGGTFNRDELIGLDSDDHTQYLPLDGYGARNRVTGEVDASDNKISIIEGSVRPEVITIPSTGATNYYAYYTAQVLLSPGAKVTPKLLFSDVLASKPLGPIIIRDKSKESLTATYFYGKFLG
jgi:hypothetical protein